MLTWAYGITTVPERAGNLLPATLDSLKRAGFDRPTLFVDGALDGCTDLNVIQHPRVGQLHNWLNALFWLYSMTPRADRFAIFEDDILICRQAREYLDRCPLLEKSWWNLLTHDDNISEAHKVLGWQASVQLSRGAAGLVFDRRGVECILRSPEVGNYLKDGGKTSETAVSVALRSVNYREMVHYPSLIQHVGWESTLGHSWPSDRLVKNFLGEDFHLMSIAITTPMRRRSTQCNFQRNGDYMVCTNPGCDRRVAIVDALIPPEKYQARCRSPEVGRNNGGLGIEYSLDRAATPAVDSKALAVHEVGLGGRLERLLSSLGITTDRYIQVKELFGLPPTCNCGKRKEWLNRVSDWWRGSQE